MRPRVLKTESDHVAALARAEKLMDAKPGSADEQELELWSVLIEKYEEDHFPIPRPDPIAAIQFRMEQMGLDRADLLRFIPSKSKVSEVLNRRRPLSLPMIRALHSALKIPAEILVQASPRRSERRGAKKKKEQGQAAEKKRAAPELTGGRGAAAGGFFP